MTPTPSIRFPAAPPPPDPDREGGTSRSRRKKKTVRLSMPVLSPRKRATIATALKYGAKLVAEFDGLMLSVTLEEER